MSHHITLCCPNSFSESFNPDDLPEEDLPEWARDEKANFDHNLDLDQNGRLDKEEIKTWMVPDDATLFNVEAHHLFYNADTNRVSRRRVSN